MQRLLPRANVSGRKGFGQSCSEPFSISRARALLQSRHIIPFKAGAASIWLTTSSGSACPVCTVQAAR